MDRGARWATVHGVAWSRTRLKRLSTLAHTHCLTPKAVLFPTELKLFWVVELFLKKEQSPVANLVLECPEEEPSCGARWGVCFILSVKA